MYFLGKNLSDFKRVYYALLVFEGVGMATAQKLCHRAFIHPMCKVKDLQESHLAALKTILQPLLDEQKQKRLLRMKLSKTAIKPILPT